VFGKLDRYLARSFLWPFLLAALAIAGLYVVADAFSHVDEYVNEADGIGQALSRLAQAYFLRLPSFLAPVAPVAMLVGAAHGIAQLSGRNEINAMKASGLSFWRILCPMYAMAVLAAGLAFANRELLVPEVERISAPEIRVWTGRGKHWDPIVDYISSEQTYFTLWYNVATGRIRSLFVARTLPDGRSEMFSAAEAEAVPGGWRLRQPKGTRELLWKTSLRPRDLEAHTLPPEVRPISILRRDIRLAEREGEERERSVYRYYYGARLAYPFTGIVLIALGVPFVIGHEKLQRSRMLGIGVCMAISMVFYAVEFLAADLGKYGQLPPEVAAWLPIILFGALGLYLLETVHG